MTYLYWLAVLPVSLLVLAFLGAVAYLYHRAFGWRGVIGMVFGIAATYGALEMFEWGLSKILSQ